MGWKGICECEHLKVVDTYGSYAAFCKKNHQFCNAAEPVDNTLKKWTIVSPEYCEKKEWNGKCKRCDSELLIFKNWGMPNWWWCQDCDAVYDENGAYRGKRKRIEENEQHLSEKY